MKLAPKALAKRMKKIINCIIHCDQTAYVKGRYIGELVLLIEDLIAYADKENPDGIMFPANNEKAFDSVEHNFVFAH